MGAEGREGINIPRDKFAKARIVNLRQTVQAKQRRVGVPSQKRHWASDVLSGLQGINQVNAQVKGGYETARGHAQLHRSPAPKHAGPALMRGRANGVDAI